MNRELILIAGTAASLGIIHTILGPDHYIPFIVISRARRWNLFKTLWVTLFAGLGHILSSVIIGLAGIALGVAVFKLEAIESFRGEIAAWLLIAFGLLYGVWGLRRAARVRTHEHKHDHADGIRHEHKHNHQTDHMHVHPETAATLTPWILFTIFVFGPCEPLIPLVMYPAAKHNFPAVAAVALIFGLATISTMIGMVAAMYYGVSKMPFGRIEKYSHALAGLSIFLCGAAVKFLGL